jgi:urease accessory protein
MPDASSSTPIAPTLERADGGVRLKLGLRDGRTRIETLYQRAPARILFPDVPADQPAQAVLLNTAGGIVGGDRLSAEIEAGPDTVMTVTTQAAEKVYRALDVPARLATRVQVAAGAWFEWLPQETILFDGARLDRRLDFVLETGAALLASETVLFGRAARGEQMRHGQLLDSWAVRRDGRLIWADRLKLAGDLRAVLDRPFGFDGAVGMTTLLHAGPKPASFLPRAREITAAQPAEGGASLVNGILLIRFLDRDGAKLRESAAATAMALRHEITGLSPTPPRVWRS